MAGRNFWLALYIMHQRVIFKLHNVMRKIWFVSNDIRSTTCSVLLSFDGGGTRTTPGSIVSARCKSSASKRTRRSLVERQTATVPGLIRWNRERIRTDWDPVIFPRFQSAVQTAPLRKNQFKSSDDAVVARLILDGRFHVTGIHQGTQPEDYSRRWNFRDPVASEGGGSSTRLCEWELIIASNF